MSTLKTFLIGWLFFFVSVPVWAQTYDSTTELCSPKHGYAGKVVPDGAQFATEMVPYPTAAPLAPLDFDHLVAWMTVTTVDGCINRGDVATVEVAKFSIIERSSTGQDRIVFTVDYQAGTGWLEGVTFTRFPTWYSAISLEQPYVMYPYNGGYKIDVGSISRRIWHPWTQPRIAIDQTARYFIEVTMKVTGAARVQIGYDFWKGADSPDIGWSEGCLESNNCQGSLSFWYTQTGGKWKTFRSPSK